MPKDVGRLRVLWETEILLANGCRKGQKGNFTDQALISFWVTEFSNETPYAFSEACNKWKIFFGVS